MSEVKIYRLDSKQLNAVRQKMGLALSVNSNTTPLEAGMQIGMARALDILREGFTVESDQTSNDG